MVIIISSVLSDNNGMSDINGNDLYAEILHINSILFQGREKNKITPREVLNFIKKTKSKGLFTNCWVVLRILLTVPDSCK